jgi:hypothetical protein
MVHACPLGSSHCVVTDTEEDIESSVYSLDHIITARRAFYDRRAWFQIGYDQVLTLGMTIAD